MMGKVPGIPLEQPLPPISELIPGKQSKLAIRGIALAHMDEHLKGNPEAGAFLRRDLVAELARKELTIEIHG